MLSQMSGFSFLFLWKNVPLVDNIDIHILYTHTLICLTLGTNLACVYALAIVLRAAKNTGEHISFEISDFVVLR